VTTCISCRYCIAFEVMLLFSSYRQDAAKRQTAGIVLFTAPKSAFSHLSGDSLHRFMLNLVKPRGTWVRLATRNFASISSRGCEPGPNICKFPLYGKESLRRGEPFDRFLKFLGAFMRPDVLRKYFKFHVIRFAGYRVIAEKSRVGHLPRNFPCTV